jgi:DNA polymerase-1
LIELFPKVPEIDDNLLRYAARMDVDPLALCRFLLSNKLEMEIQKSEKANPLPVVFLPGTKLDGGEPGPRESGLMIVNRYPTISDIELGKITSDLAFDELASALVDVGIDLEGAYYTNLLKFGSKYKKTRTIYVWWQKIFNRLLYEEIKLVNPDRLLLLGSDVCKYFLGKKLSSVQGVSEEIAIPSLDKVVTVFPSMTPAGLLRTPADRPTFLFDLEVLKNDIDGTRQKEPIQTTYHYIQKEEELSGLIDQLIEDDAKEFAVDVETAFGLDPKTGMLLTVQFSWEPGQAATVILNRYDKDKEELYEVLSPEFALKEFERLFYREGVEIVGHNFKFDLSWLVEFGLDLSDYYTFDTMFGDHILEENRGHSLTECTLRYTTMGRYDQQLKDFIAENNIGKGDGEGFESLPEELLWEYGCKDVDATLRCKQAETKKLDENPELWDVLKTDVEVQLVMLEMEEVGLKVDVERVLEITRMLEAARLGLIMEIRRHARSVGMEEFNPNSYLQVGKLLYDKLGLTPIRATDKTPWYVVEQMPQEEIEKKGLRPATDKESLSLLEDEHPVVSLITRYRTVDKQLNSLFQPPEEVEPEVEGEEPYLLPQEKSLLWYSLRDGRLHTNYLKLTKTGRWSSRNPNVQNLPNRKDTFFKKIIGDDFPPIRSCVIADEGYVLMEADYAQAELNVAAMLSGDEELWDVLHNPERDIHAEQAIRMHNLPWKPEMGNPKQWLKEQSLSHLRDYAKAVVFGTGYQGGAFTLYLNVSESGVECSIDDCKDWQDIFFDTYKKYRDYPAKIKRQIYNHGYISNPYGRRKHFYHSQDPGVLAAQERECINFPIQSTVGAAIDKVACKLKKIRDERSMDVKLALQLHDALYFLVKIEELPSWLDVLEKHMKVKIPGYETLNYGISLYKHWGEKLTNDDLLSLGVEEQTLEKIKD